MENNANQPEKKSHKKFWLICAAIVLLLTFIASCNRGNNSENKNSDTVVSEKAERKNEGKTEGDSEEGTEKTPKNDASGKLGDHEVTILDSVITKDYEGKPALVVNFTFKNNSDDAAMFSTAVSTIAYQSGVQLSSALIFDSSEYDAENSLKNVQKGGTLNCQAAYILSSDTEPVTVEVSELFSFSNKKITKVFEL